MPLLPVRITQCRSGIRPPVHGSLRITVIRVMYGPWLGLLIASSLARQAVMGRSRSGMLQRRPSPQFTQNFLQPATLNPLQHSSCPPHAPPLLFTYALEVCSFALSTPTRTP